MRRQKPQNLCILDEEVIEMYLEAWLAEGESIPEPNTLQIA